MFKLNKLSKLSKLNKLLLFLFVVIVIYYIYNYTHLIEGSSDSSECITCEKFNDVKIKMEKAVAAASTKCNKVKDDCTKQAKLCKDKINNMHAKYNK